MLPHIYKYCSTFINVAVFVALAQTAPHIHVPTNACKLLDLYI